MPRMKADSKGRFRACGGNQAPGTRQFRAGMGRFQIRTACTAMPRTAAFRRVLIAAFGLLPAAPAWSEMIYEHPGVLQSVTPGWFCQVLPDAAREDLEGKGKVNLYRDPFDFVATGDTVPSQPGIGIGVVAQLGVFGRNDILMARESHGNPCCGKEQRWLTRARPDGLIWLGYLNEPGTDLPPGEWRFSLWRGAEQVFAYRITVLPPDPAAPHPCGTPTS